MSKSKFNLDILYEDDDILCVSKPAHISVHHDGKTEEVAITDLLVDRYPEIRGVGESVELNGGGVIERPGIVHRLDKDTSGVLLVAKNNRAYEHLKLQFKNREIKKTYNAFVYGNIKDERGMIDKSIGRSIGSVRKWAVEPKIRGEKREAVTRFKVIARAEGVSYLEVWPLTGRTHQIRVHMLSIGHPVVCDGLYAPLRPSVLGFNRLALHSSRIVFKDVSNNEKEVLSPLPNDFVNALKSINVLHE